MKQINLLIALIFPLFIFSQIELKGQITNSNEPIIWANVTLSSINSDKIIGSTTNFDGEFTLNIKKGVYNMTVSYVGYISVKKQIELTQNTTLGTITLKHDPNILDEVVIKAQKKLIEQKVDRLVLNVENSIIANSGDAVDALKLAPGLQVDNNGTIEMFGKGETQVMVNGRLLPMSGEELTNYLNSIAGSDIKKIEIITTPPAKYTAAGNGGLINIILKTGKENAWKNTVSLIHNIDSYNYTTLRNNLVYNKDKINMSLSLNKTKGFIRGEEDAQIYYPDNTWSLDILTKDKKDALSGRLFLDYQLTNKTGIGFQYLGSNIDPSISDNSTTTITNSNRFIDSLLINKGRESNKRITHSINLHSTTILDTLGKTLSFDADYFTYDAEKNRIFNTNSFNANTVFLNPNLSAISNSNQKIKNYSFKTDIEYPLKTINLSYGAKISRVKTESNLTFFNTITGTPILDTNISNTFMYTESNQAVYINANKKLNKKWQFQLGLRFENTETEGFSDELNKTTVNNYSKLFPTIYASYIKNDNNTFSFSYAKRIQRPRFNDLNPFRVYVSSNTFSEGNPFLQASFNDNFELKHSYKNKLNSSFFVNINTNASSVIFRSNAIEDTQIITRENYYNSYTAGLTESYNFSKVNWLQSQNSFTLLYIKSEFTKPINATPQNGFSYTAQSSNSISLSENNKLQIDANYTSKTLSQLYSIGDSFSFDLGYSTTFLEDNLKCSVLIKDVFATSYLDNFESVVNGIRQVYGQNRNNRYIRFSINYSFGNPKMKTSNRNFGNQEETNRAN